MPPLRYSPAGAESAGRVDEEATPSGGEPSVVTPHTPRVKRIVSFPSLPNATSFRRSEDNRRLPWRRFFRVLRAGNMNPVLRRCRPPDRASAASPALGIGPIVLNQRVQVERLAGNHDRGEDEAVSYPDDENRSSAFSGIPGAMFRTHGREKTRDRSRVRFGRTVLSMRHGGRSLSDAPSCRVSCPYRRHPVRDRRCPAHASCPSP